MKNNRKIVVMLGIGVILGSMARADLLKDLQKGAQGASDNIQSIGQELSDEFRQIDPQKIAKNAVDAAKNATLGTDFSIPGIQGGVDTIKQAVTQIKSVVSNFEVTMQNYTEKINKTINDLENFGKVANIVKDLSQEAKNDVITALVNPSKIQEVTNELTGKDLANVAAVLPVIISAYNTLIQDLSNAQGLWFSLRSLLDQSQTLTRSLFNLLNGIQTVEQNTGKIKEIIPSALRNALINLVRDFSNLVNYILSIFNLYKNLSLQTIQDWFKADTKAAQNLASGLIHHLDRILPLISEIRGDVVSDVSTTKKSIATLQKDIDALTNSVNILSQYASRLKQLLIDDEINFAKQNPVAAITAVPLHLQAKVGTLIDHLKDVMKKTSPLLRDVTTIVRINVKTTREFDVDLGVNIIPNNVLNIIDGLAITTESISRHIDDLRIGLP